RDLTSREGDLRFPEPRRAVHVASTVAAPLLPEPVHALVDVVETPAPSVDDDRAQEGLLRDRARPRTRLAHLVEEVLHLLAELLVVGGLQAERVEAEHEEPAEDDLLRV